MKSYAQAGQDLFAYRILGEPKMGTFLDIGANHPVERNNTYGLEQLGWRGLCVDNDEQCFRMNYKRALWFLADATKVDWKVTLVVYCLWPQVDYLSLDCDQATYDVLSTLPFKDLEFRVATIEHDRYRFGDGYRNAMRSLLQSFGYVLLCADVSDQGLAFEDWYVNHTAVDMNTAERYRSERLDWKEVLKKGQL